MQVNFSIQELSENRAIDYLAFLRILDAQSEYMHYKPNERPMNDNGMKSRIKKMKKQGNQFVMIAIVDGHIEGYMSVNGGSSSRTKHSATIAAGVSYQYRGGGIARELWHACRMVAKDRGINHLTLTVVYSNGRAIEFYKAAGFRFVGVLRRSFNHDGFLLDEHIMERAI